MPDDWLWGGGTWLCSQDFSSSNSSEDYKVSASYRTSNWVTVQKKLYADVMCIYSCVFFSYRHFQNSGNIVIRDSIPDIL